MKMGGGGGEETTGTISGKSGLDFMELMKCCNFGTQRFPENSVGYVFQAFLQKNPPPQSQSSLDQSDEGAEL